MSKLVPNIQNLTNQISSVLGFGSATSGVGNEFKPVWESNPTRAEKEEVFWKPIKILDYCLNYGFKLEK